MSWCAGFNGEFWRGYHSILPKEPGGCESQHPLQYVLPHVQYTAMPQCLGVSELSSAVCGLLAPGACAKQGVTHQWDLMRRL